jgi:hypothetical protein
MATTTNYSWSTPDDVSLVKDGASAIRTLGSSADTTVKALNPGTTAGDIDYYTTSTTKARVGIGTAGQVLAVNSGATAPEWITSSSGGMTLLSTTTLSGATTTISAISGSYTDLVAYIFGVTNATGDGTFRIAPNGSTNISHTVDMGGGGGVSPNDATYIIARGNPKFDNNENAYALTIYNYASTTARKPIHIEGSSYINFHSAQRGFIGAGAINTTSAITSLVFSNSGGNLSTGTVLLYGVK